MRRLLPIVVTALLVGTPAQAQVHAQDTTTEIDKTMSWATPATPGCGAG